MKTLIILGNGPSLKDVDLQRLTYYDTFGLNGAFIKFEELDWYPKYYGCFPMGPQKWEWSTIENFVKYNYSKVDRFFFFHYNQQNMNLEGFPKATFINNKLPDKITFDTSRFSFPINMDIDIALNNVNDDEFNSFSKFIITCKKKDLMELNHIGLVKKFRNQPLTENDYVRLPRFKISWIPPSSVDNFIFTGGNSAVIASMIGIVLGYKKIILLGVDCNWTVDNKIVNMEESYWFNNYFDNKTYDIRDFCEKCTKESIEKMHFDSWQNLKDMGIVNNLNIDIVNCSEKSKLDLFRRSTIDKELNERQTN